MKGSILPSDVRGLGVLIILEKGEEATKSSPLILLDQTKEIKNKNRRNLKKSSCSVAIIMYTIKGNNNHVSRTRFSRIVC